MVFFTFNKIFLDSETIAEQLRTGRQAKNLKLTDVAKKLNIKYEYLDALEKNQFEKLPAGVYGKNFLREYALFLRLDHNELLKIFERELSFKEKTRRKELFSRQVAKSRYFLAMPKIARNIIIAAVIITCFSYLGYRLQKIISPPRLFIYSP